MSPVRSRARERVQTTVRLPRAVYEKAQSLVVKGAADAGTFNDLVVSALVDYVQKARRRQIDQAFAAMSADADYQESAQAMAIEFEESDWEAFQRMERP